MAANLERAEALVARAAATGADVVVLPVNPTWDGAAPSLADLDEPVDLVDVFRRPEHCADVARDAVAIGAGALWLQLGIRSAEARTVAEAAGLDDVEDACTAVVHRLLG